MRNAPKSLRLHIGLFGRRNAGKSSLLNALTRQAGLDRLRDRRHDHRPGGKADGNAADRAGAVHRYRRHRRRGGTGRNAGAEDPAGLRPHRPGPDRRRRGPVGRVRGRHPPRVARAEDPRRRRLQQGGSGQAAGGPAGRTARTAKIPAWKPWPPRAAASSICARR